MPKHFLCFGIITAVGTLWGAITDPLVGMWSDNRDPKKGRRRWFLLWNSVIFGLVFWLLFTDWGFPTHINMIYFTVMILAYKTTHTILDIPYTSLGAEMTQDYDERSSLNSFRNFFGSADKVGYKDYFEVLKNKSFRKVATAAAILLVGYLIKSTGYDPNAATQTFGTIMNINSVHAYSTLAALVITVVIGVFYPITPKYYNALLEALEAKKTGREYSIDGFRELLSKEDIEREEEVRRIA